MFNKIRKNGINFLENINDIRYKSSKKRRIFNMFFRFSVILLLILAIFVLLIIFLLFQPISNALSAKNNAEDAVFYVKSGDFSRANQLFISAEENFSQAGRGFKRLEFAPVLGKYFYEGELLAQTGVSLSRAGGEVSHLADSIFPKNKNNSSYKNFSSEEKKQILKNIFESAPELNGIKASLSIATGNLKILSSLRVPIINAQIANFEEKLSEAEDLLNFLVPATKIIPELAGYPESKKYLFLLQNSDELRPTGGFLGTYGIMENYLGDIKDFRTHDVYHVDMPAQDKLKIKPPVALEKYLGVPYWYLRDANWSPDFPTSAEKVEWFFAEENKLLPENYDVKEKNADFNGVIAITPNFIESLLDLTGPIELEGINYNKNNFSDLLEYRVEKGYPALGVSKWQRKEVIGTIAKEIKIRLLDLPKNKWSQALSILQRNITSKDLIIYFNDPFLEQIAQEANLAGEIQDTNSDYIGVFDANMAAFKTDSVVNKSVEYSLSEKDGELFATTKVFYAHRGGFDWRTTRYRSYTRLYAPQGSKLISINGASDSTRDMGEEFGKTYFGAFISVEPGQTGYLEFEYKLPKALSDNIKTNNYSLYVQKQPGARLASLKVNLNFNQDIKNYSPRGFSSQLTQKGITWKSDFNSDKFFQINF